MLQWLLLTKHSSVALKLLSNDFWQVWISSALVLTTSVLVILASRSVRLSRVSLWSVWSSCRPQTAAPMLPVAIMEGGFMARRSSGKEKGLHINVQLVIQVLSDTLRFVTVIWRAAALMKDAWEVQTSESSPMCMLHSWTWLSHSLNFNVSFMMKPVWFPS